MCENAGTIIDCQITKTIQLLGASAQTSQKGAVLVKGSNPRLPLSSSPTVFESASGLALTENFRI